MFPPQRRHRSQHCQLRCVNLLQSHNVSIDLQQVSQDPLPSGSSRQDVCSAVIKCISLCLFCRSKRIRQNVVSCDANVSSGRKGRKGSPAKVIGWPCDHRIADLTLEHAYWGQHWKASGSFEPRAPRKRLCTLEPWTTLAKMIWEAVKHYSVAS